MLRYRAWLVRDPVDLRKGSIGLLGLAEQVGLYPEQGHVIIFLNRRRNALKILLYSENRLWLYQTHVDKVLRKYLNTGFVKIPLATLGFEVQVSYKCFDDTT